jgi:hypothetical protein
MGEERGRARHAADRLWRGLESSTKGTRFEEQQRHLSELLADVPNPELRHKISLIFEQQQKTLAALSQTTVALVTAQQHNLAEARAAFEETLRERSLEVDSVETLDDLSDDVEDDEPPRRAPFAHVPDDTRLAARLAANAPVEEPLPVLPGPHAARKAMGKAKQRKAKDTGRGKREKS